MARRWHAWLALIWLALLGGILGAIGFAYLLFGADDFFDLTFLGPIFLGCAVPWWIAFVLLRRPTPIRRSIALACTGIGLAASLSYAFAEVQPGGVWQILLYCACGLVVCLAAASAIRPRQFTIGLALLTLGSPLLVVGASLASSWFPVGLPSMAAVAVGLVALHFWRTAVDSVA